MVSILCITYNHEKFISDTLVGFILQQTTFPIEVLIHDDASTDKTPEILRSYERIHPDLITVIYQQENKWSQGIDPTIFLYKMARGKYIAWCEGDDYWTDPLKLQKQVAFLESHPECILCHHKVTYHHEDSDEQDYQFPKIEGNQIFTKFDFYKNSSIKTCSVLFKNILSKEYYEYSHGFNAGDTPLWYYLLQFGDFGFLDESMAVYRLHKNGIWSPLPIIEKTLIGIETHENISRKLNISPKYLPLLYKYLRAVKIYHHLEDYQGMRKYLIKCYPHCFYANTRQLIRICIYTPIAFFPFIDKLVHFFRKSLMFKICEKKLK